MCSRKQREISWSLGTWEVGQSSETSHPKHAVFVHKTLPRFLWLFRFNTCNDQWTSCGKLFGFWNLVVFSSSAFPIACSSPKPLKCGAHSEIWRAWWIWYLTIFGKLAVNAMIFFRCICFFCFPKCDATLYLQIVFCFFVANVVLFLSEVSRKTTCHIGLYMTVAYVCLDSFFQGHHVPIILIKKQWPRLQSYTGMEFWIHSVSGFSRLNYDHPGYIVWFWPGFASAVALQDSGFQDVRAANRVEMDVKTTGDWMRVSLILCGFKEWCLRNICSCLGMSHQVL